VGAPQLKREPLGSGEWSVAGPGFRLGCLRKSSFIHRPTCFFTNRFNLVPDMKSDSAPVGLSIRIAGVLVLSLLATVCHGPTDASQRVTSVDVFLDSGLVYVGESLLARAVAHDVQGNPVASATITWSSRDSRVATVSPLGWVQAIKGGRTSILADAGSARDSLIIIVLRRGVTALSPRLDTLVFIKQNHQLVATTTDSTGPVPASYLWVSRDANLVSVTQSGRITARANGATWIVATEDGGSNDSARVVVRQRTARVVVTPAVISRPVARSQQFSAVALDSGGTAVAGLATTWSSAVPAVATIDTAGLATASGTGVDTIRAQMGGVSGLAVLTARPLPRLGFTRDTFDVGVGQYATSFELPIPRVVTDSLGIDESFYAHLSVADTLIGVASESSLVRDAFTLVGRRAGLTTVTASAPRYVAASAPIRVSTPRLKPSLIVATSDTVATNEILRLRILVTDSLGHDHYLVGPLTVTAQSSDTTVIRPQADTLIVAANDVGVNTAVLPLRAAAAWVRYAAAGYRPDSVHVVIVQPRLQFVDPPGAHQAIATIGVGQYLGGGGFVSVATGSLSGPDTVRISISQRHPERVAIPPNELQQSVLQGSRAPLEWFGKALGLDTIVASAPGYSPDTLLLYVTTPRYRACPLPAVVRADQFAFVSLMPTDSTGANHYLAAPVRAVVTSSDTTVLRLASDTVGVVNDISCGPGDARIIMKRVGSATLTFTDPAGMYETLVTPPIAVQPAPLVIGLGYPVSHRTALGMRQRLTPDTVPFVSIPDYEFVPVPVTLRSTNPAVAVVSPSQLLLNGTQNVEVTGGDTTGTAWIVAEGPGVVADSMQIEVGRPQFVVRGRGAGADTLRAIAVEVRDHLGNLRTAAEQVVATITSSNFTYVVADSSTLTVPAGARGSGISSVRYLTPGSAILRASDPRAAYYRYEPGSTGELRSP